MIVFWFWAEDFSTVWRNSIGRVLKTTFHMSKGTFCELINVIERVYFPFLSGMRQNSLWHFAMNFWQGLQICSLRVQRNILKKTDFFYGKNLFWKRSRTSWRKFLGFQQKTIGRFAQTTFQMSRGTLSAKKCEEIINLCILFSHGAESFQTFGWKSQIFKKNDDINNGPGIWVENWDHWRRRFGTVVETA